MHHDAIIVGGCSGTIPDHIRHIAEETAPLTSRGIPACPVSLGLTGLELVEVAS